MSFLLQKILRFLPGVNCKTVHNTLLNDKPVTNWQAASLTAVDTVLRPAKTIFGHIFHIILWKHSLWLWAFWREHLINKSLSESRWKMGTSCFPISGGMVSSSFCDPMSLLVSNDFRKKHHEFVPGGHCWCLGKISIEERWRSIAIIRFWQTSISGTLSLISLSWNRFLLSLRAL